MIHQTRTTTRNRLETLVDVIILTFQARKLDIGDISSFLSHWQLREFSFCEKLIIDVSINSTRVATLDLEKKQMSALKTYLTLEDKPTLMKLYSHPEMMQIWFHYLIPEDAGLNAEITIDILQKDLPPKKRRQIRWSNGMRTPLHQAIRRSMPHHKFAELLDLNDIAGLYVSTRSVERDILYSIIDIDVSDIVKRAFPPQIVWELTLNAADALLKTFHKMGLGKTKVVNFSGSRGLHIVYKVEYGALRNLERVVDLPIFHFYSMPGKKNLVKNKASCYHSGFALMKKIMQAIGLFTIYRGNIQIPKEIIKKLGIRHPRELFRISVFSVVPGGVLLDTSSDNQSVFRIFSAHLSTKKVSIPLINPDTGKFFKKYLDYEVLLEDSEIEAVVERLNKGETAPFLLTPSVITRKLLTQLFQPDFLFPTFAIMMRFSTRYVIQRSSFSFDFWYRLFELRGYYEYTKNMAFIDYKNSESSIVANLAEMGESLDILNLNRVVSVLQEFLEDRRVSYMEFSDHLDSLYNIEFFFGLRNEKFIYENREDIKLLFSDKHEFSNFLRKVESVFSILLEVLFALIKADDVEKLTKNQKKTLYAFSMNLDALIELTKSVTINKKPLNEENKLIKIIHLVCEFYFDIIEFFKQFFDSNKRLPWFSRGNK